MSKLSRGEKGENKVIELLNKEKGYFHLINNLTLQLEGGLTHQIDHLFINEKGVFVIESKSIYGDIKGDLTDSIWVKVVNGKRMTMANPIIQNKSHVRIIKKLLGKDIDIISIVVFTLNNAPYFPDENVINLNDLPLFIESYPEKMKLTNKQIDMINNYLLKKESDASMEEHLANIKTIKKERNDKQKEMRIAIEQRICPRCGNKITIKGDLYRCNKCDFHFHL